MFFLLLLIFPSISFQQDSRTITYQGECVSSDPEMTYCLPYGNSSILLFLGNHAPNLESCVNSLNILLQSHTSDDNLEFRSPFSLNSLNFIKTDQTLLNFSSKVLISNKKIERKFAFPELNPREFFYSELEFETAPHDFQEEFKFMHNFLFHLAFFEEYALKEDLLCLPQKIEIPLITFTDYEIDYLLSKEIGIVGKEREIIRDLYFYFKKILGINYEVEQRKRLLFGETDLKLDDFVYLYAFVKSRLSVERKQKLLFLAPMVNHLKNQMVSKNTLDFEFSLENNRFLIKSKTKVNAENELYFKSFPMANRNLFLYKGWIPDENEYNCFQIELFDEETAKELNEPTNPCIAIHEFHKFRYWFVMGTLMNYKDEKSVKKCKEFLRYTMSGENDKTWILEELMDGKYCKYIKWEKRDIWSIGKEFIKETKEVMKANVKVSKEYEEFREKEGVAKGNSENLRRYYEKNLEYLERIEEEIKFYDEINEERSRKNEL